MQLLAFNVGCKGQRLGFTFTFKFQWLVKSHAVLNDGNFNSNSHDDELCLADLITDEYWYPLTRQNILASTIPFLFDQEGEPKVKSDDSDHIKNSQHMLSYKLPLHPKPLRPIISIPYVLLSLVTFI